MRFVSVHVIWFTAGIGFRREDYPFGLLITMIVSLEAIFLSTFVVISQNRADEKRQVLADQQWQAVQDEERQNGQLLNLSNRILELTKAIHAMASARPLARPAESDGGSSETERISLTEGDEPGVAGFGFGACRAVAG